MALWFIYTVVTGKKRQSSKVTAECGTVSASAFRSNVKIWRANRNRENSSNTKNESET